MSRSLDNALRFLIFSFLFVSGLSCTSSNDGRPSILVIAADSLPSELLTCSESQESLQSIATLCQESVRFTHAFTTSTLSAPALSSVLTAELPVTTGLIDNASYLPVKWETNTEVAVAKGYKSLFVSGGAPLLSRTGLTQGFEVFDDYLQVSADRLYRPLAESAKIFEDWLVNDAKGMPFYSVLYTPEINFIEVETREVYRVSRDARFLSQMEVFDQGLGSLFSALQRQKRWDSTIIVLVGLSGISPLERKDSLPASNLYTENTQVVLMIKPAGKKRDRGLSWKVDQNVSLQDLGQTLFELMGQPRNPSGSEVSLRESMLGPDNKIPQERWLPIFDHWTAWRKIGGPRMSAVSGSTLLIIEEKTGDEKIRAYNTLLDRNQTSPGIITELPQSLSRLVDDLKSSEPGKVPVPGRRESLESILTSTVVPLPEGNLEKANADKILLNWLVDKSMEARDWKKLIRLGNALKNQVLMETSRGMLSGVGSKFWFQHDLAAAKDPCTRAIGQIFSRSPSEEDVCRQPEVNAFMQLLQEDGQNDKYLMLAKYLNQQKLQRAIVRANLAIGYIWDGPDVSVLIPTDLELLLLWPQAQKISQRLKREYGQ